MGMVRNDLTFMIGGAAGQGVESSGAGFVRALAHTGLHAFAVPDYMSRIRGGHNFFQIRVADRELRTHSEDVHLVLALDEETVRKHGPNVVKGGGIIFDQNLEVHTESLEKKGVQSFAAPLLQIATEEGNPVMANTAALGVAAGITEMDFEAMDAIIRRGFAPKGDRVVQANLEVARQGYALGRDRFGEGFAWKLLRVEAPGRMVLNGNEAFAMGALLGGCKFVCGYPMTPATPVLHWFAAHGDQYGAVIKHVEDEIAAINMAIGANLVGVRSMAVTSGGGFSLMVEALGLAAMSETPLVLFVSQRPGPSTGMPTRSAQGDLLFSLFASQDEFPRIVLAPHTHEESFTVGWRAFNLAEKYQTPVIVLGDHHLSAALRTVDPPALRMADVVIDRGQFLNETALESLEEPYLRYRITDDGISPRAVPGHPQAVYSATSDEHLEDGHIDSETAENRTRMHAKRLRKLETALSDIRPPLSFGPENAELTLIGWGSTYGAAREAVDRANREGASVNLIHFVDVWPFPRVAVKPMLEGARRTLTVENNATGQMGMLIRMMTGHEVGGNILKWDGRPFTPEEILAGLEREVR
jgi:2-oxoglutarate ferredoxin oxidoreductase subunit alpha